MKKFKKLAGLVLAAALAMGFAACSDDSDSGSPAAPESHEHTYATSYSSNESHHWYAATCEHTTEKKDFSEHTFGDWSSNGDAVPAKDGTKSRNCSGCSYKETVTDIGTRLPAGTKSSSEAKAVGDIVFNDGSSTPYTAELTLTADQKAAAIAVIFKAEGGKTLGIGLKHDHNGLAWCTTDAKAYNKNITTIQCLAGGSKWEPEFSSDTDGSDNLDQIALFLGEEDDTNDSSKYSAFYYAKNYKNAEGTNVKGTDYEDGWYLPTIAELYDVWKVKATVESASKLCAGSKFEIDRFYWSSSQYASLNGYAYLLNFNDGSRGFSNKETNETYVCAIRSFN